MSVEKQKHIDGTFKKNIFRYIKAFFISLIITFACIILFAFIIKWASVPDNVISPVNMAIKAISVFFGVLILTKGSSKGLLQGVLFAGVYTVLAFVIFSLLAQSFSFGLGLVADIAFACVVGAIGGVIGVGIENRKKVV